MRIRTQLVAAFLLLAVVPLTTIVLFSYFTSIRAVERAAEAEASERTAEMDQRMKGIRTKVRDGMAGLSRFPFDAVLRGSGEGPPADRELMDRLMAEIGDAAPFMDGLVVVPRPPRPPTGKDGEASEAPPAPGSPAEPEASPFRIDFLRLKKSLEELQESPETAAELEESREAMAELGRESAEMAIIALTRTLEALGSLDDEEARQKIEEKLTRELEQKEEKIARQIERATRYAAVAAIRAEERRAAEEERRRVERLLDQDLGIEIQERGEVVAEVHAEIKPDLLLDQVLGPLRNQGEIPFFLDREGQLQAKPDDREMLESLDLERDPRTRRAVTHPQDDWIVVSTFDPEIGMTFGAAYPIGASLAEIRRTTARNLAIGLGLVVLALLGVLPVARHITLGLETVSEGAKQIAHGDLSTRVEVVSKSEIGLLAAAFNRMAEDLETHQARLIEEEGRRKEQELEFERKSRELEDARQFQLSLLPKSVPRHPSLEVAVDMKTAAEVGGDYYDFQLEADGTLTFAIGDATGHGARAGTMVTVVKSLFSSTAAGRPLSEFLRQAARTIKKMDLGRMAMALTVGRFEGDRLTISAAGMPPALIYRAGTGEVEELALPGMPLGSLASDYQERETTLETGDTLLLLSDGLPELPGEDGEPLGYPAVREAFAAAGSKSPDEVIEELTATAARWAGRGPPSDDMTFLVVKRTHQPLST